MDEHLRSSLQRKSNPQTYSAPAKELASLHALKTGWHVPGNFGEREHSSHVPQKSFGGREQVPMFPKNHFGEYFGELWGTRALCV